MPQDNQKVEILEECVISQETRDVAAKVAGFTAGGGAAVSAKIPIKNVALKTVTQFNVGLIVDHIVEKTVNVIANAEEVRCTTVKNDERKQEAERLAETQRILENRKAVEQPDASAQKAMERAKNILNQFKPTDKPADKIIDKPKEEPRKVVPTKTAAELEKERIAKLFSTPIDQLNASDRSERNRIIMRAARGQIVAESFRELSASSAGGGTIKIGGGFNF